MAEKPPYRIGDTITCLRVADEMIRYNAFYRVKSQAAYTGIVQRTVSLTREQASVGHTALMDWSSFLKLIDKGSVDVLRQRLTFPVDPMNLRESLGAFLVDLIARFVVYDGLLLDISGRHSSDNPLSSEAVRIAQVRFEPEVYQGASDTTFEYLRTIEQRRTKRANVSAKDDFFYADLKNYADEVSKGFAGNVGVIAESNRSIPRTLFYLEMSRQLGLQLFLSYEKRDLLQRLEKRLWQDAFSLISSAVDDVVMKPQALGIEDQVMRLQTPAVVDLIIRRAFDRKISLEESIIEVRNLEGAQQFRDLLAKVQRLLMFDDRASLLKVNKLLAPLLKAAKTWAAAADPEVRWLWQAKINKLPKIGEFLETMGIEVPAIPIKGHFRSYVQFVSEWYKTRSDGSGATEDTL